MNGLKARLSGGKRPPGTVESMHMKEMESHHPLIHERMNKRGTFLADPLLLSSAT